jgi:hypothetical protein
MVPLNTVSIPDSDESLDGQKLQCRLLTNGWSLLQFTGTVTYHKYDTDHLRCDATQIQPNYHDASITFLRCTSSEKRGVATESWCHVHYTCCGRNITTKTYSQIVLVFYEVLHNLRTGEHNSRARGRHGTKFCTAAPNNFSIITAVFSWTQKRVSVHTHRTESTR